MVRDYGRSLQSLFEEEDFEHYRQRRKRKGGLGKESRNVFPLIYRWSQAMVSEKGEGGQGRGEPIWVTEPF